jgi:hypothetical protein
MRRLHGATSSSTPHRSGRDREKGERKRPRVDDSHDHHSRRSHRLRGDNSIEDDKHRRRKHDSYDSESDHHRSSKRHRHSHGDENDRSRRRRESSRSPNRSSRRERETDQSRHRHRHSRRSPSQLVSRSRSPRTSTRQKHDNDKHEKRSRESDTRRETTSSTSFSRNRRRESVDSSVSSSHRTTNRGFSDDDSDPLEDLIGPLPRSTPREHAPTSIPSRGRGAYRSKESNIDAHFAADYNPNLDVRLDEEEDATATRSTRRPVAGLMTEDDDWEMALEALRDRAQWKQKGAERLREAGFGEQVVDRWTNDPAFAGTKDAEGSIEAVRWSKKAEGREWDRGKVMTDDHYDVKAQW